MLTPKILIIGEDIFSGSYDLLERYGEPAKFKSVNSVRLKPDEQAVLIIIEKDQHKENAFKEFSHSFLDVPKIVVTADRYFRGFAPWQRFPFTCPVHTTDQKTLLFYAGHLIAQQAQAGEIKQLKNSLDEFRKEIAFVNEVGLALSVDQDLDHMLSNIMKKTKEALKASSWSIFLIDDETGELVLEKTDSRKGKKDKTQEIRLRQGEGVTGWVAKEGIPLIVPDVSRDQRLLSAVSSGEKPAGRSLICVPIRSRERIVGVVEFTSRATGNPFTKDDLNLLTKVIYYIAFAIERSTLYHKMAELAITDDLTKLFNSRYLNRTIEVELQRSDRSKTSVALIFMDIDYFKKVNDRYGHLIGSKLLVEVGQLLIRSLRSIDIVARYGGDEFVIVLPQTPTEIASKVAERIRKSIEQSTFLKKEGYFLKVTASFGVASYPETAKSKEDLLKLADEAMYRVKNHTRNGVYAII